MLTLLGIMLAGAAAFYIIAAIVCFALGVAISFVLLSKLFILLLIVYLLFHIFA